MDFTNNFWLIQMKFVSSQKENTNLNANDNSSQKHYKNPKKL